MIHKVVRMIVNNRLWYYQEFTPDELDDEYAVNLYDSNGDFFREFDSYEKMMNWIKQE